MIRANRKRQGNGKGKELIGKTTIIKNIKIQRIGVKEIEKETETVKENEKEKRTERKIPRGGISHHRVEIRRKTGVPEVAEEEMPTERNTPDE